MLYDSRWTGSIGTEQARRGGRNKQAHARMPPDPLGVRTYHTCTCYSTNILFPPYTGAFTCTYPGVDILSCAPVCLFQTAITLCTFTSVPLCSLQYTCMYVHVYVRTYVRTYDNYIFTTRMQRGTRQLGESRSEYRATHTHTPTNTLRSLPRRRGSPPQCWRGWYVTTC
jgi:hypothetical protein